MSNYETNKAKIMDDYYKCVGTFENFKLLYGNKESIFDINPSDTEESKKIKKGRVEDLLSNLGKVGEKAFKYIFGLRILELYPNLSEEEFDKFFRKKGPLKDMANKKGINDNSEEFQKIINYEDFNKQENHNYHYWYLIIQTLMEDVSIKFKNYIEYKLKTSILVEYCKKEDRFKDIIFGYPELSLPFKFALAPFNSTEFESIPKKARDSEIKILNDAKIKAIEESGDIFTRYRYAFNNRDNKTISLDKTYEIIEILVNFINIIHKCNDKLDFDLEKEYFKEMLIENQNITGIDINEINKMFSLDLNAYDLDIYLLEIQTDYNHLKNLLDCNVSKEDLTYVLQQGLTSRSIKYYNSIGIYDYDEMIRLIEKHEEEADEYLDIEKYNRR